MSCECTGTPICLEAWVNVCNVGTLIGLEATQTGTWTMRLEFNGAWTYFGVEVEEGEEIAILTSLLNENYVHQLRVYNVTGGLVGCYKLKTYYSASASGAPVPPVASGSWDWITLEVAGGLVSSIYLTGEISPNIFMGAGGDINWSENGVVFDPESGIGDDPKTGSLDFTGMGGYDGLISLMYRNLNP